MATGVPLPPSAAPLFPFVFVHHGVDGGSLLRAWAPPTSSYPEVARGLHLLPLVRPRACRRPRPLRTSSGSMIARRLHLRPDWARVRRRTRLRPRARRGRGQDLVKPQFVGRRLHLLPRRSSGPEFADDRVRSHFRSDPSSRLTSALPARLGSGQARRRPCLQPRARPLPRLRPRWPPGFAPRLPLLSRRAPERAVDRARSLLSHRDRGPPTVVGARGAGPARPCTGAGKAARMHACAR